MDFGQFGDLNLVETWPHLHHAAHVHKYPDVGHGVKFKLFDHQPSVTSRTAPMDTVETVTRYILPYPRDVGGGVVGAPVDN